MSDDRKDRPTAPARALLAKAASNPALLAMPNARAAVLALLPVMDELDALAERVAALESATGQDRDTVLLTKAARHIIATASRSQGAL